MTIMNIIGTTVVSYVHIRIGRILFTKLVLVPYHITVRYLYSRVQYRTAEIFFYAVVSTIVHGRDRYDFSRRLVTVPYGTH